MENGDETLSSPAVAEKTVPNGGVPEEVEAAPHPAKSYAAVAAVAAEKKGVTVVAAHPVKSYAAVAANAEIEDLRATKLELEGALAKASQENQTLAAETHRLEGLFSQAREDVATAELAAATTDGEVASLRAEVERLQALLNKQKFELEMDKRHRDEVAAEVETSRQVKLNLEKEIEALKASGATSIVKERETISVAEVPKEEEIAWQGMAMAAAAGATVTTVVVLLCIRFKR